MGPWQRQASPGWPVSALHQQVLQLASEDPPAGGKTHGGFKDVQGHTYKPKAFTQAPAPPWHVSVAGHKHSSHCAQCRKRKSTRATPAACMHNNTFSESATHLPGKNKEQEIPSHVSCARFCSSDRCLVSSVWGGRIASYPCTKVSQDQTLLTKAFFASALTGSGLFEGQVMHE